MQWNQFKTRESAVLAGGLAGLLPFLGSALGLQLGLVSGQPFINYSVIILAFLCGVIWWLGISRHTWGEATPPPGAKLSALPLALVIPAGAWLVMFLPDRLTVLALACAYLAVWVWEMLYLRSVYQKRYLLLRTFLTSIVVLSHFWVLAFLGR